MIKATFAHVGLTCKDPDATEKFYAKHFGFRRVRVIGSGKDQIAFIKSAAGDLVFELFRATEERRGPAPSGVGPNEPTYRHLALMVDDVDKALAAMGPDCLVTAGPSDFSQIIPGWRTAWIADPDGRIVEITQGYRDDIKTGAGAGA